MSYLSRTARMERHHKRHKSTGGINLVSMIDMLTVLLFFLLVYSTEAVEILPSTKDVQLPESLAEENARQAVVVVVTESEIRIDDRLIVSIAQALARDDLVIPELRAELVARAAEAAADGSIPSTLSEEEQIAAREVTIMADKELPYRLVKRVMATSTAANYGQLSLAVLQKASEASMITVASN